MKKYDEHKIKTATTRNAIAADGILKYYLKSVRLEHDRDGYLGWLLSYINLITYLGVSIMKTFSVFARYFAILAMLILTSQNTFTCPPDPTGCTLVNTEAKFRSICSHDPINDTYCCVNVEFDLKTYSCPAPPSPKYTFEITKIEVVGSCAGGQTEIMQTAFKAVIAAGVGLSINNASINIPNCVDTSIPGEYTMCPTTDCCYAQYFASWDTTSGDYYLHTILVGPIPPGCTNSCDANCNTNYFPDPGSLNIGSALPVACLSTCNPDATIPYSWAVVTSWGDNLDGLYSLGTESDNTPCFSFHYFWEHSGSAPNTPEKIVEKLVKSALKDIWLNGNPQYISVNLPKCIGKPYPGREMYVNCSYEEECCRVKFEIIDNGNKAKVVSITPASGICVYPCIEICDIFTLDSEYGIPKLSVLGEYEGTNPSIKVIPNPTTGVFNIEFDVNSTGTHTIKVVDMLGIEIFNQSTEVVKGHNSNSIDLTNIPTGTYYIQLLQNGQMLSNAKFIKN